MSNLGLSKQALAAAVALAITVHASTSEAQPTAPPPPPPVEPWYHAFDMRAFADAYASINYNFPKPQRNANGPTRPFDIHNGFSLAWVGLDVAYDPDPVGGTLNLRFGPTAEVVAGSDADNAGLQYVKQAFASWKPGGSDSPVTLDFGKFDTIYGAEVAESQDNMNYTRGIVYNLAQPFFHTGLRAGFEVLPELSLTALVVNGYNNTVDNNTGKSFGLQVGVTPTDNFGVALGWIGGPEQDDSLTVTCAPDEAYDPTARGCAASPGAPGGDETVDRGGANDLEAWRHLVDLVVTYDATDRLSFVFNGDFGVEGVRVDDDQGVPDVESASWWGVMLGARYQLTEHFGASVRGEYFDDSDAFVLGVPGLTLATASLTLEATPTDFLVIRLEQRGDFALDADDPGGEDIFQKEERDFESTMTTTTLGVVVTTN